MLYSNQRKVNNLEMYLENQLLFTEDILNIALCLFFLGIKLDFKTINAVEPSLDLLRVKKTNVDQPPSCR